MDELTKTYWSAATGNKGEWIQTDLGNISTVNAVQINYADQDAEFLRQSKSRLFIISIKCIIPLMGKNGMCWWIKAIIKQMCRMIMWNWQNLYRQDLLNWKIFICQPANLPSVD